MEKKSQPEKQTELTTLKLSPGHISTLPADTEKLVITDCSSTDWSLLFKEMHKLGHLKWLAITNCKL